MAYRRFVSFFYLTICLTLLSLSAQDQRSYWEEKIAEFEATSNTDSLTFYYQKQVKYARKTDDLADWADSYFNWQYSLGDEHSQALSVLDSAIQGAWRKPKSSDEAMAMAYVHASRRYHLYELGKILQAVKAGEAALALYEGSAGYDPEALDYFYTPMAGYYTRLGDNEKARILCKKAINSHPEGPKDGALAGLYNNLGRAYWNDGDSKNAIAAYLEGLACTDVSPLKKGLLKQSLAESYLETGAIKAAAENASAAIALLNPLENSPSDQKDAFSYLSGAWLVKAKLSVQTGRFAEARVQLEKAMSAGLKAYDSKNHRDLIKIQIAFGKLYLLTGKNKTAAEAFHSALCSLIPGLQFSDLYALPDSSQLYEENTIYEALEGKADALQALYRETKNQQDLQTALGCHHLAGQTETLLRHTFQYESSKIGLLSQSRLRIEKAISIARVLWEESGDDRYLYAAWANAEQAKSALLLEAVQRNRFGALLESGDTLLLQMRALKQQLASFERFLLEEPASPSRQEWILQKDELLQQLSVLEGQLQKSYPDWAKVRRQTDNISGASIRAIGKAFSSKALIEYFAGDTHLEVFGQSAEGRLSWERLDAPDSLAAKTQQFLSLLQSRKAMEQSGAYRELAYELYRMALLPTLSRLEVKSSNLIVIPDAWLSFLPFEALFYEPSPRSSWELAPFLLKRHGVQYAFSLAVLESQRSLPSNGKQQLLQLAPRFADSRRGLSPLLQSAEDVPFDAICNSHQYLDEQASFEVLKRDGAAYRIVHLSTHAGVDTGGLLPRVELYDRAVFLPDIYALQLQADLVVLSACQTGLGQFRKGEGVMSLSRAFTYAGAKGLISSLWTINEAATGSLFRSLYRQLLAGNSKPGALRNAKLEYLTDKALPDFQKSPYYWAGLIYLGDEGKLDLEHCRGFSLLIWPGVLLILVIVWIKRRALFG